MDKHVRRSGDDYTAAYAKLLPDGAGWPRDPNTTLMQFVRGLCQVWGDPVDARAADLLERESDPRLTIELLPDWERNWGLPEPCMNEPTTFEARRQMLIWKMTLLGGQSREFFYSIADMLGYTITIREYAPFMVGVSNVGDTHDLNVKTGDPTFGKMRWEIGAPEMRFYWTVAVSAKSLIWFRCGASQCGVDPHLRIGLATDLECLLRQYAPAHTQILFDYSATPAPPVTTFVSAVSLDVLSPLIGAPSTIPSFQALSALSLTVASPQVGTPNPALPTILTALTGLAIAPLVGSTTVTPRPPTIVSPTSYTAASPVIDSTPAFNSF
jgi:uncharacterized protein YmfQ (DUF2313 family)